jgi:hypothetical protein
MIEKIRELFQNLIAPQLEALKGDIRALDSKSVSRMDALDSKLDIEFDALESKLDTKFEMLQDRIAAVDARLEVYRRELLSEIRRVEETLSADFVRLEQKVDLRLENIDARVAGANQTTDTRLATMNEKLEFQRRELLAEIRAALK